MKCSNCGSDQADANAFCEACGSPVGGRACSYCREPLSPDVAFCQHCGMPVGPAATAGAAAAPPPPPPPPPYPAGSDWSSAGAYPPPGPGYQNPGPGSYPPPGAAYPPPPGTAYTAPGTAYTAPGAGFPPPGYPPPGYPPPAPPGSQWGGSAPAYGAAPGGVLASWGSRAGAYLLDAVISGVPALILVLLGRAVPILAVLGYLWGIAVWIWFAVQVGSTGQSPGMRMVGLKCVSSRTGELIGGGKGFVRALCHSVLSVLCGIGSVIDFLFPLWDRENQTLADKMVSTVVITVPKRPFSLQP